MATGRRAAAHLEAYVLHRYDWSETSLILDLFTREQGRLAVAAKGAKRPYSQLRSVLLPFQRIHVGLGRVPKPVLSDVEGADANGDEPVNEVQNLRSAEWAGGAAMLTGAALFSGFYLNELLMRLTARHDPHPALFDAYAQTLPALVERDDGVVEAALRAFEIVLLKELGVLPDLSLQTLTLAPVEEGGRYALLPDAGVAAGRGADGELAGSTLIGLQAALEHGSLAAVQSRCAEALPELKTMLRTLLHYHLGSPVMRTRQVMLDVQNLSANPSSP